MHTATYRAQPVVTRQVLAAAGLALVVAAGLAIAVGSAAPHSALIRVHAHTRPDWLAGPLEGLAPQITFAQFLLLLGGMSAGYALLLAGGVGSLRPRLVLISIVALHVAFLLAPPLLSSDVFNYIDYARLGVVHGLDPYAFAPSAARHDPVFALAAWHHVRSAYGPLFTLLSYPVAQLGVTAAMWVMKLQAFAAGLACVALVWRIAGQRKRSPVIAAAVFGLNPILLVYALGGAHNDLLMLAVGLGGVTLALDSRVASGAASVVAAAAVKASAGLVLPFLVLGATRRRCALVGAIVAGCAITALAAVAFPGHAFGPTGLIGQQNHLVAFDGVPNVLAHLFGLPGVTPAVRLAARGVLLATLVWLAVRVHRGADWVVASGWALLAAVVTSPWLLSWYAVWPLPFAAFGRSSRLLAATLGLEAFFVVEHVLRVALR